MGGNISVLHDENRFERFTTTKVSPLEDEPGPPGSEETRRMARPKKQDGEKRDEVARFRVTLAEREYLRAQARAAGISETEYLRRRALGYAVSPARSNLPDPTLISELNRIGVNVNQLARATHRGSDFVHTWQIIGRQLSDVLAKEVRGDL